MKSLRADWWGVQFFSPLKWGVGQKSLRNTVLTHDYSSAAIQTVKNGRRTAGKDDKTRVKMPLTFLSNGLTINVVNILANGAHLCYIVIFKVILRKRSYFLNP